MDIFQPQNANCKRMIKNSNSESKAVTGVSSFDLFAYAKHHGLASTAEISKFNGSSKITLLSTDYISG